MTELPANGTATANDVNLDPAKVAGAAMKILTEDPRFKVTEAEIRGNVFRVFENAPPSLTGLLMAGAAHGDKPFLIYEDEVWTFAQTWEQALRLADGLKNTFGLGKGDKIGIAMRNYPEWCVAYMAICSLGAVSVPLNAWWKTEELEYAIRDCGVKHIFVDARRLDYLKPIRAEYELSLILTREDGDGADHLYADVIAAGAPTPPVTDIDPEDDLSIVYTSGSTGSPKGVVLTHRGAVSALMSFGFLAAVVKEVQGGVSVFGNNPGILLGVPLFHVTGSHAIFLLSWMVGRRMAIMYRWDAVKACELIRKFELTNFVGVPAQSFELIDAAGPEGLPSILDIGSGGAKRPPDHVRKLKKRFANANPSSGYGLSETNAIGAICSLGDYQRKPDAAGKTVPPLTDIKIVGDDGADCAMGDVGEVWIRSAALFRGYHNLPEATEKAITPDGWFQTGDLGKMDEEGFLYIVDRLKDLIIRGGENISCLEVEGNAYTHDDVAEACVFSVPDDVLGERVGLLVYAKEGKTIEPQALRDFMAQELAGFKVPERIWLSPQQLPRLGTGKFDKITIKRFALQAPPHWKV